MKNIKWITLSILCFITQKFCWGMEQKSNEVMIKDIMQYFQHPPHNEIAAKIAHAKMELRRRNEGVIQYIITDSSFDSAEEMIEEIEKLKQLAFEKEGTNFELRWHIFSREKPKFLKKILKSQGFSLLDVLSVRARNVQADHISKGEINPAIHAGLLDDVYLIPDWAALVGRAFNCLEYCNGESYHKIVREGVEGSCNREYYAGYYNDKLAATGAMAIYNKEKIGAVFAVTTAQDFRKKGLATGISSFILQRARELDLKYIVFETSHPAVLQICNIGNCVKVCDNYRYIFRPSK